MCNSCPRQLGVKRYWYLPHWTMPDAAKLLARFTAMSYPEPVAVVEYDCDACGFIHTGENFFKFRTPITVEGVTATHFGLCPEKNTIVYMRR